MNEGAYKANIILIKKKKNAPNSVTLESQVQMRQSHSVSGLGFCGMKAAILTAIHTPLVIHWESGCAPCESETSLIFSVA